MQVQGEILFKGIDSSAGDWVYSPWMVAGGDKALVRVEILLMTNGVSITWGLETKREEEVDSAAVDLFTPRVVSSVPTQNIDGPAAAIPAGTAGVLELVRFKFATGSGADASEWVSLRPLDITWLYDKA